MSHLEARCGITNPGGGDPLAGGPRKRGQATFKERDVTAAIRAAKKAGLPVARVEIGKDGSISIIPHAGEQPPPAEPHPWDED